MDLTPLIPGGRQIVESYGEGRFRIAGQLYAGAVLVFPERTLAWPLTSAAEANLENLEPILAAGRSHDVDLLLFGLITAWLNGYIGQALTVRVPAQTIGIGMWLALIMAANVWFVIWPNQKKALGIVTVDADAKKAAARLAMLASRTNTMLSLPMLYCMVGQKLL